MNTKNFISFSEYYDTMFGFKNHIADQTTNEDILLIGIHRGGTIPTTLMDYSLTNHFQSTEKPNKVLSTFFSTAFYDKKQVHSTLFKEKKEQLALFIKTFVEQSDKSKKIYIVDDLLDTGKTLNFLVEEFNDLLDWPCLSTEYICLYDKATEEVRNQLHEKIEAYGHKFSIIKKQPYLCNCWLDFWYETLF